MSISHSLVWKRPVAQAAPDEGEFRRKRLKLSDLPVTGAKKTAIDGLLVSFKKSGGFDKIRKAVYQSFESSDAKLAMMKSIEDLTETEIERQANYLLSKDRRQAAALIEGAVERSNTYKLVDKKIDELVQSLIGEAENALRKVRETEIGEDAALEELKKGGKTDQEYLHSFAERKQLRLRIIDAENEIVRKKEAEAKRKREEDRKREEEEEAAREQEAERERAERRERLRKEREERERELEDLAREREKEREDRRREREDRRKREDNRRRSRSRPRRRSRSASRARDGSRGRYTKRYSEVRGSRTLPTDEKDLEAIALAQLLNEGHRAANVRSTTKPDSDDEEETFPPPPRKKLAPKSIVARDPVVGRRLSRLDALTSASRKKDTTLNTPITSERDSRAPSVMQSIEKAEAESGERMRSPSPDRRMTIRTSSDRRGSQLQTHRSPSQGSRQGSRRDRSRSRGRKPTRSPSRTPPRWRLESNSPRRSRTPPARTPPRWRRNATRSASRTPPRRTPPRWRRDRDRSDSRPAPVRRDRSASNDSMDIDRYIPNTSRRSPIALKRRDREDDRERDRKRPRSRTRSPSFSRSRSRSRTRRRARSDSRDDGRSTRARYAPDEIDRYVPPTSKRGDLQEFAGRDASRDRSVTREGGRDRDRKRSPIRRDRSRERVRRRSPVWRDSSRNHSRSRSPMRRDRSRRRGEGGGRDRSRGPRDIRRRDDERPFSRRDIDNERPFQRRDAANDGRRRRSRSASNFDKDERTARRKDGKSSTAGASKAFTPAPAAAGAAAQKQLHFSSLKWVKPGS